MLYVFDPLAMHNIIVKDQYIFEEATWFIKYVPQRSAWHSAVLNSSQRTNMFNLGPGLLATLGMRLFQTLPIVSRLAHEAVRAGDHHRKQRKLLNPVFSIAHMRRMIPIFNTVGHRVRPFLLVPDLTYHYDITVRLSAHRSARPTHQ